MQWHVGTGMVGRQAGLSISVVEIFMRWLGGAGPEEQAICRRHIHFTAHVREMITGVVRHALQEPLRLHCQRFPVKILMIRVCGMPDRTGKCSRNLIAQ